MLVIWAKSTGLAEKLNEHENMIPESKDKYEESQDSKGESSPSAEEFYEKHVTETSESDEEVTEDEDKREIAIPKEEASEESKDNEKE